MTIPPKMSDEELRARQICVIGYPNSDFRNDAHVMRKLLRGVYGVARLMPGRIVGLDRWGPENAVVLSHDAMTMSGTSGAPVVDIESGHVLGVHVAGEYLKANYAVPAWELGRDPQWRRIWKKDLQGDPKDLSQQVIGIGRGERLQSIFSFDEIIDLHRKLVEAGISDNQKIAGLFGGLPNEYVGLLPSEGEPSDKLLARLHAVNNLGGMIGEHSVFYYILNNGERMRGWDSVWNNTIRALLAKVIAREKLRGNDK